MRFPRFLRRPLSNLAWRRNHERDARRLTVDWHLFGSGVHRVSTTADASEGGVFLCSVARMPVGSPLVMHLELAHGRVEVHGRVAWTDARGMGVRFGSPIDLGLA